MYLESHVCLHDLQIPVHRDTFFQCERDVLRSTMVTKTIRVQSVVKPVYVVGGRGWGLKQPLGVKSEAQGQQWHCPGASLLARPRSPHVSWAAPCRPASHILCLHWLSLEEPGVADQFGTVRCTCIDTGSQVR